MVSEKTVEKTIYVIVGVVILASVLVGLTPSLLTALGNMSALDIPLASLFATDGVLLYAFSGGLIIFFVAVFLRMFRAKK